MSSFQSIPCRMQLAFVAVFFVLSMFEIRRDSCQLNQRFLNRVQTLCKKVCKKLLVLKIEHRRR